METEFIHGSKRKFGESSVKRSHSIDDDQWDNLLASLNDSVSLPYDCNDDVFCAIEEQMALMTSDKNAGAYELYRRFMNGGYKGAYLYAIGSLNLIDRTVNYLKERRTWSDVPLRAAVEGILREMLEEKDTEDYWLAYWDRTIHRFIDIEYREHFFMEDRERWMADLRREDSRVRRYCMTEWDPGYVCPGMGEPVLTKEEYEREYGRQVSEL